MTDTPAVELMIMSGPEDGKIMTLAAPKNRDAYLIGRLPNPNLDVTISYDNQVSRQHARLFMKDGQWYLQDVGSKNGTYIGKHKLESIAELEPGQMFRVGRTWLRIQRSGTDGS